MQRIDIKSLPKTELCAQLTSMQLPPFRAKQVFDWLHKKQVSEFEQMTNLSAALRKQLDEKYYINTIHIKKRLVSRLDGTVKYLYELRDGNCVEAVFMRHHHGNSLCISTQVGCRMGCKFCASTLGGLVRSLTPAEMLDEVYMAQRESGLRVDSLVLMGIGEPLDNFDNVLAFLGLLSDPDGLNLSLRHVSLSTCGLVDKIYELARYKLQLTLSVSLHAPNDTIRNLSMPINKKYSMDALLEACRAYFEATGRRVSFEYALILGVNDSQECAKELARRLAGMHAHVNIIPVNPVEETGMRRGDKEWVRRFVRVLQAQGQNATVRRELGSDISAACGQLRRQQLHGGLT